MRQHDLIAVLDGDHSIAPVAELRMVPHDGLTAVLSSAPRPALRLPKSRRETLLDAARHLRLQEACLTLGTLLPAEANVALALNGTMDFLQASKPVLSRLMQRFSGQVQVQITVGWDESTVLGRFRDSPELSPLFATPRPTPQTLQQAIAQLARRLSGQIDEVLAPAVTEIASLPLAPSILWNGAVLVPHTALDRLCAAVQTVDAIWTEGLQIRQIGPAPVASFALIGVTQISGAKASAALRRYGPAAGATRRANLMGAGGDAVQRDAIRAEASIAEAAARLQHPEKGFALVRLCADASAPDLVSQQEVA